MLNIILCCASGMSTSLLVEKMKKSAHQQNIKVDIWAVSTEEIKDNALKADVILLGPQVRYAKKRIEDDANGVPVAHIGMREYGMMNGEAVLKQAIEMIEKKH